MNTAPTIKARFGYREVTEALGRDGHALTALRQYGFHLGHPAVAVARQDGWEEFLRSIEEVTVDPDWDEFIRTAEEIV